MDLNAFPYYKDDGTAPMPQIHQAIRRGDLPEVMRRLNPFVGFNYCDGPGWMPLHIAVLAPDHPDRYRILAEVLFRTCCVSTTDGSGKTALAMAIARHDAQAEAMLRAAIEKSKTNILGI